MSEADLSLAADVFWSRRASQNGGRKGLQFKRFASLAEAVRFLMEDKSELRSGCSVETDEASFSPEEIESLYMSMTQRSGCHGET